MLLGILTLGDDTTGLLMRGGYGFLVPFAQQRAEMSRPACVNAALEWLARRGQIVKTSKTHVNA